MAPRSRTPRTLGVSAVGNLAGEVGPESVPGLGVVAAVKMAFVPEWVGRARGQVDGIVATAWVPAGVASAKDGSGIGFVGRFPGGP
jgi:hypothetical protein